jgi:hypothetical protein
MLQARLFQQQQPSQQLARLFQREYVPAVVFVNVDSPAAIMNKNR